MAIRDPIDALEKQFENENLSSDPVVARLARVDSGSTAPLASCKGS